MLMTTYMLSPRLMSEGISFFCSHAHRQALILLEDEYTLQIRYPFRFPLLPPHGAELNSLLFHYPYFLLHFLLHFHSHVHRLVLILDLLLLYLPFHLHLHSLLLLLVMPNNLLILCPLPLLLSVMPNNLLILYPFRFPLLPPHGAELNSLLFHYPYFLLHFLLHFHSHVHR